MGAGCEPLHFYAVQANAVLKFKRECQPSSLPARAWA